MVKHVKSSKKTGRKRGKLARKERKRISAYRETVPSPAQRENVHGRCG